jgi:hypothetical protein
MIFMIKHGFPVCSSMLSWSVTDPIRPGSGSLASARTGTENNLAQKDAGQYCTYRSDTSSP